MCNRRKQRMDVFLKILFSGLTGYLLLFALNLNIAAAAWPIDPLPIGNAAGPVVGLMT